MQQVQKKMEHVLDMCENRQKLMSIIEFKLKHIVKNSNNQKPNIYLETIRLKVICLVIDCYLSSCQDRQKGELFKQMQKKKGEAVRKIRQNQSILAIQGKMRSNSSIMNSYVTATKVAYDILTEKKQNIAERHLFQRLHIMLTGKKLSEKCYKLVESRTSLEGEAISKKVKQTIEKTDNELYQFKAIFESNKQLQEKEQDKKICQVKQKREVRSSSKILKLLKKVEQTIRVQSKKYRLSQIKQKQEKRKRNLKRQLSIQMGQKNEKQRKSSLFQQVLRKNSFRKRVGKLNETDNIRFRFLELKNIQKKVHMQEVEETDLSMESILNEDEDLAGAEGKLKIKRVFTLQMPLLVAQKCGKQRVQEY